MRKVMFLALFCLFFSFELNTARAQQVTQGELEAVGKDGKSIGECPLKSTNVKVEISGFISRVKVTQEFENNFDEKIEAVYVFPLPSNAAVDDMTMRIGERIVRGKIMKRDEAREVYEAAKSNGQIASLLDQERPNIFTQSVANILPKEKISIEISYVETLNYEDGKYELIFPMTVAPRYIPASVKQEDAQKISPPIAATRAGHDVSIEVSIDAGVPIENVISTSHEIETTQLSANSSLIKLKDEKTIPNKDFVLRYDVSGKKIEDAILTNSSAKGGYFTLILQPPDKVAAEDATPKEIVFVLDTSGSMSGFPIEKAKESMKLALDNLNPQDTFNLITFAGDTHILFDKPVQATVENLQKAQAFLASRKGDGGTEMMQAVRAALEPSDSQQHIRVVCFMTDGEIGNDNEILAEIQKHPNARVFSFGIGSSVNRFLLDKMAQEGRGEAEFVSLTDDGSAAAKRFYERVRSPLLTDISIDFGNLAVADVYPKRINDLFSAKPIVVYGRFTQAGTGVIRLKGKSFGREIVREIPVNFPENEPNHDVLATLWARTQIADLMSQDYTNNKPETKDTITNLGIEYRLLTEFTSFVAIEERIVTDGGQPRKIEVPVELPDGASGDALDPNDSKLSTNITAQVFNSLPKGTSFSSLLKTSPRSATTIVDVSSNETSIIDTSQSSLSTTITNPLDTNSGTSGSSRRKEKYFSIDGASDSDENKNDSISGKTTKLPKPVVSSVKNWDGTDNIVNVKVLLDATGNVLAAVAESGNQLLRVISEDAARNIKFKINQPAGKQIQITGIVSYNFALENKKISAIIDLKDFAVKLSPEELKRREIAAKVSNAIFRLIERLSDGKTPPDADEAKFVKDGKAEIVVRLKELKSETIEELKKYGFEVLTEISSGKAVVGRIQIEKIMILAQLESVTFISPQNR
jgi:Ca-activated chloride channel family protein